jgi:hypothetical protein
MLSYFYSFVAAAATAVVVVVVYLRFYVNFF